MFYLVCWNSSCMKTLNKEQVMKKKLITELKINKIVQQTQKLTVFFKLSIPPQNKLPIETI